MRSFTARVALVALLAGMVGCGGDGTGLSIARTSTANGDGQTGPVAQALPLPLRVIVTDEAGAPVSGITVNWSTGNGGSFDPAASTTGSDGIATTVWTLGGTSGGQRAEARVSGAANSPIAFTATATGVSVPTVNVTNNTFSPATVTISAGGSVRFLWGSGSVSHTVTPASGNASALPISPGSPTLLDAPQDFTVTFPTAGTYRYYCVQHGSNPTPTTVAGMSGTVTVN